MNMANESKEILNHFVEESRERLDEVEECLLIIEKSGFDKELINRVFRSIHTVKGGSGFFDLKNIGGLSHVMEDVLMKIRDGVIGVDPKITNTLLTGE